MTLSLDQDCQIWYPWLDRGWTKIATSLPLARLEVRKSIPLLTAHPQVTLLWNKRGLKYSWKNLFYTYFPKSVPNSCIRVSCMCNMVAPEADKFTSDKAWTSMHRWSSEMERTDDSKIHLNRCKIDIPDMRVPKMRSLLSSEVTGKRFSLILSPIRRKNSYKQKNIL